MYIDCPIKMEKLLSGDRVIGFLQYLQYLFLAGSKDANVGMLLCRSVGQLGGWPTTLVQTVNTEPTTSWAFVKIKLSDHYTV